MAVSPEEELHRVMAEIVEAFDARAAMMLVLPDSGAAPHFIDDGESFAVHDAVRTALVARVQQLRGTRPDEFCWHRVADGDAMVDIFCMPVEPIENHSPLLIAAVFGAMGEDERRAAEAVYLRRRPFAIGYFRLWQQDRARQRRLDAVEEALNLFDTGVILLDRGGRIAFANRAATARLDARDGLRRHQDGLIATDFESSLRLQVALDHALQQDGAAIRRAPLLLLNRTAGPPLIVSVLPTRLGGEDQAEIAAILYLVAASTEIRRRLEPICRLHGLTPVETDLVCLLASGESIKEAAQHLHIKEPAARSCLKQAFVKTGTHRQIELTRMMLSSVIRMTPDILTEVVRSDNENRPSDRAVHLRSRP